MPELWIIIPVKPFAAGKSRLAGVLDAGERAALSKRLFHRVFDAAVAAMGGSRIAVVTSDPSLAADIERRGAHGVVSTGDLNPALADACGFAMENGAQGIMVLPSDLPFIAVQDIAALAAALPRAPAVVIAPDAAEQATNALALAPPDPDFFRFGAASFAAHLAAARERGATVEIVRRGGLAFDLDTPDDYRAYLKRLAEQASP